MNDINNTIGNSLRVLPIENRILARRLFKERDFIELKHLVKTILAKINKEDVANNTQTDVTLLKKLEADIDIYLTLIQDDEEDNEDDYLFKI